MVICVLQIQQFVFLDEKVVGIKLRKDDCSAFPAIYFSSPSMGQGESSPATTEDLTNAVCTFNGQLPHLQAVLPPSHTAETVAGNVFLVTGCRPLPFY